MAFSIEIELENGEKYSYDGVVSYTVEESSEPSPDEVPEEGEEEREGGSTEDGDLVIDVDLEEEELIESLEDDDDEEIELEEQDLEETA